MGQMRRTWVLLTLLAAACGGGSSAPDAMPPDAAPPVVTLNQACNDTTADIYTVPAGLPAWDGSQKGDVFRCAPDQWLSAERLDAIARAEGYDGDPLTSGATIFRIAYRTERAAAGAGVAPDGHSAAFLFVPDQPRDPGALIVYVHGAEGIASSCLPTHIDPAAEGDGWKSVRVPLLGLVGNGWTVIAPDLAGYDYGDAPGFDDSEDEGKSVLDATRAAKKLLPADLLPAKVVIVGHSMGGHAALSADAMAPSYGLDGDLVGVVGLAPFWVSNMAWAALMTPAAGYDTTNASYVFEYQLQYFYGHGELLDGPGHGLDLIQPAKQAQVTTMLTTECLDDLAADMANLGTDASDYFDPTAAQNLAQCAFTGDCTGDPAPTWQPRFYADRPAIDTSGPPIAIWYGGKDITITPAYAQCEVERLARDLSAGGTTAVTTCHDPDAEHLTVGPRNIGWVSDWIAAKVAGTAAPTCPPLPDPNSAGGAACPGLPPNDP